MTPNKQSLYQIIGGESGVFELVKVFYDIVETAPEGRQLLLLHLRGNGVAHSRVEQFHFLSDFLGGPKLYLEKHGHANVKKMHDHVEISPSSKDAWLTCMSMAIDIIGYDAKIKSMLMTNFTAVAERLINRND